MRASAWTHAATQVFVIKSSSHRRTPYGPQCLSFNLNAKRNSLHSDWWTCRWKHRTAALPAYSRL